MKLTKQYLKQNKAAVAAAVIGNSFIIKLGCWLALKGREEIR
jgi:high-affinity K+ transport system ATPase subunit B